MEIIPVDWDVEPRFLLYRADISDHNLQDVSLAIAEEVSTFKTEKRRKEHLSGRKLLYDALTHWGLNSPDEVEVRRDKYRAPSLAWMHGVWKNQPLPGLSICHSGEHVWVALIEPGWSIGVDVESADRVISANALDLMSKGEELEMLRENPAQTIISWTSKEAVQKAMGKGMHFNPRDIVIPDGIGENKISIGNLIFELKNLSYFNHRIAISLVQKSRKVRVPEDDLLDATMEAMSLTDWGVGCNTTRNNA